MHIVESGPGAPLGRRHCRLLPKFQSLGVSPFKQGCRIYANQFVNCSPVLPRFVEQLTLNFLT